MRKFLNAVAMALYSFAATAGTLDGVVPTNWTVWYSPGAATPNQSLAVFGTGSTCYNGMLTFSGAATVDDIKEFNHMIMAAKLAGAPVYITYSDSSTCTILTFGFK